MNDQTQTQIALTDALRFPAVASTGQRQQATYDVKIPPEEIRFSSH